MSRLLSYTYFASPIGSLLLAGDEQALYRIGFPRITFGKTDFPTTHQVSEPQAPEPGWRESTSRGVGDSPIGEAIRQLREYFAGKRLAFDLPLAPTGTPFQRSVWRCLQQIPYGATISYAQLAVQVGKPNAARAVGSANGKNPLPIVIPCHRVIHASGGLGGFGGGLPTKKYLLDLESRQPDVNQPDANQPD